MPLAMCPLSKPGGTNGETDTGTDRDFTEHLPAARAAAAPVLARPSKHGGGARPEETSTAALLPPLRQTSARNAAIGVH
jgi:hypothetical protein